MERVRWQLNSKGQIVSWSPAAADFFRLSAQQVLGKTCAEVVQGNDGFGRPLCARCPVQREIRYGAYQASTALSCGGKRLSCLGFADNGIRVELRAENQTDASDSLASLSWAVRKMLAQPEGFFQTLQVFLGHLRRNLGMEAAELFLADPQERYLVLTTYDGVHREAFMEKPWFAWGEGYPGLVALDHKALVTHSLDADQRYLRQKVKRLGYKTYICYPLELPQGLIGVLNLASRKPQTNDEAVLEQLGLIGPMLASSLYTVLTRLGEKGLRAMASTLRQNQAASIETLMQQAKDLAGASGVRLVLANGQQQTLGHIPTTCDHQSCAVWQGRFHGVRSGLEPCAQPSSNAPRYCLPLCAGGQVLGLQQFFFSRLPQPASQAVAPILWLERLGAEVVWPSSSRSQASPSVDIKTLGGLRVQVNGEWLKSKDFGRKQNQTLLKVLLAHRGQTLSSEELCERLWPSQDPQNTQGRLHVLVHGLRQAIEPDPTQPQIVLREGDGYRLATVGAYTLDLERFESGLQHAERLEGLAALEAYQQALGLYQGDFLSDEPYADWAELERAYLRERAVGAFFKLSQIASGLGLGREACEALRRILWLDPFREEAYHRLKPLLLGSGQENEARNLWLQYRNRMEREGLPIDPELGQGLHDYASSADTASSTLS